MTYMERLPCNGVMYDDTLYPPIEEGPQRFAISHRNRWMSKVADVTVGLSQRKCRKQRKNKVDAKSERLFLNIQNS